jgi:hypothetical protein
MVKTASNRFESCKTHIIDKITPQNQPKLITLALVPIVGLKHVLINVIRVVLGYDGRVCWPLLS